MTNATPAACPIASFEASLRRVGETTVGPYRVSTVRLDGFETGFETTVFDARIGDESNEPGLRQVRCAHVRDAKRNHKRTVEACDRRVFVASAKVGDVLYASWSYEGTTVDFWVVVAVGPKSVKVAPCAKREVPSSACTPGARRVVANPSEITGPVVTKTSRVLVGGDYLSTWSGEALLETTGWR